MSRQTGILTILAAFILFTCGRPLAGQEPDQPGEPAGVANRILVDPLPDQNWQPYEMVIEGATPTSSPAKFIKPMAAEGKTGYVQYDLLQVIYTHTAAGDMSSAHVEAAKEQARRTRDFLWRNSHFKFLINLTFLVVDEYVDASEFDSSWSCDWLWPEDYDGDGESPSADILAHGITAGQFDSINLFWPRGDGGIPLCGYGGLTWFNGWNWQHLGHTMYTANTLFSIGTSLWNPFNHEFQHSIEGAFNMNGKFDYFRADYPWAEPYRFGDNWHFHAVQMRHWPREDWFNLLGEWGTYHEAPDADGDGVPDSGDLPITEKSFGSSPASVDSDGDGLDDLQEAMAGMFRGSNPQSANSDGDAWDDAEDFAPIYPVADRIVEKKQSLDGNSAGWTLLTDHLEEQQEAFAPAVYANWYAGTLYLMITLNQMSHIYVHLDGQADGFWHGRDNYAFHLRPEGDPLRSAAVQDCSPRQTDLEGHCRYDSEVDYAFERLIDPQDFDRSVTFDGENYRVQLAIPADEDTGFSAECCHEIGLVVWYESVDDVWGQYAWTFEENDLIYVDLLSSDSAAVDGRVLNLGNCGDGRDPLVALASFEGKSGQKYEVWSNENGRYQVWLPESDNPYTLTVSNWGFVPQVYEGIVVDADRVNQHESGLHTAFACIRVDPADPSLTLRLGTAGERSLTIFNDGLVGSSFEFHNLAYDGDFHSWLATPDRGWVDPEGQAQAVLQFDAAGEGAAPGIYTANVELRSGDPVSPAIPLTVTLEIIDVEPTPTNTPTSTPTSIPTSTPTNTPTNTPTSTPRSPTSWQSWLPMIGRP